MPKALPEEAPTWAKGLRYLCAGAMLFTGASIFLLVINCLRAVTELLPKTLELYTHSGIIHNIAGIWTSASRYLFSFNPLEAYKECAEPSSRSARFFSLFLGDKWGSRAGGVFGTLLSVIGIVGVAFAAPMALYAAVGAVSTTAAATITSGLMVVDSALPSIGVVTAGSATALSTSLGAASITSGIGIVASGAVVIETGVVTATKAIDAVEQEIFSTKHIVRQVGYGEHADEKENLVPPKSSPRSSTSRIDPDSNQNPSQAPKKRSFS